ncbi:osteopetrosis-associated transmembrane protein 1-like [Tubulanus polymorphus]|uniref:osteopetrosis-associated transmembrane protein 1-like n=1 Tax=Tubulanus polymorphus TaxID=672921 RepID=UPI003DA541F7
MAKLFLQSSCCAWLKLFLGVYLICLSLVIDSNSISNNDGDAFIPKKENALGRADKIINDDIMTQCRAYMTAYGKAAANLVECLLSHARPLTLCENCKMQYDAAAELFENITDVVGDEYVNCHDSLLRSDIVHVVGQTHDFVERIWKESACSNCFNESNPKYELTDDFTHFKMLVNETDECMKRYMSSDTALLAHEYELDRKNGKYNHSACDICRKPYNELNKFYEELEQKFKKAVCMDMVDTMNYTRYTWSADFQCTVKKKDMASIISLTGFFCLLPIAFYVGTKLHGSRQQKQILKQKRLQRRGSCNYGAASSILADENNQDNFSQPTGQEDDDQGGANGSQESEQNKVVQNSQNEIKEHS